MEFIAQFIQILLHLDQHLSWLIQNYGTWVYVVLFLIIFCETGLVVTPFLPGDSLLFVAGALAANGDMEIAALLFLLMTAAFSGDNTNYWIGRLLGQRLKMRPIATDDDSPFPLGMAEDSFVRRGDRQNVT